MKTIIQIKKEIEEAVLGCPYNKKKDKQHRCSDCRTETDILDALLQYSEDIIEIIDNMPVVKRLKDGSQVPFREENAIILTAFKQDIKKSIIGSKEKT